MPTTFHEIPRERPLTPLLDSANTPDELRRLAEVTWKPSLTNCASTCSTAWARAAVTSAPASA